MPTFSIVIFVNAKTCCTQQIHTYLGSFHIIFEVECFRQHMRAILIPLAFAMQFTSIKVVSPLRVSSTMYRTILLDSDAAPSLLPFFHSLKQNQMGLPKTIGTMANVFLCMLWNHFAPEINGFWWRAKIIIVAITIKTDMENNMTITNNEQQLLEWIMSSVHEKPFPNKFTLAFVAHSNQQQLRCPSIFTHRDLLFVVNRPVCVNVHQHTFDQTFSFSFMELFAHTKVNVTFTSRLQIIKSPIIWRRRKNGDAIRPIKCRKIRSIHRQKQHQRRKSYCYNFPQPPFIIVRIN